MSGRGSEVMGALTAQMLNNSVTVHTGNSTFVSWELQLLVFNKFPSPGTNGGIKLFPVSSCNVKYSDLTGQFRQSQGKKSAPLLFWCFLFVLSAFSHLKFHVLGRIDLTFCRLLSWQGVFACTQSRSPGACGFRYSPEYFVLCSQCLYFSYCSWELPHLHFLDVYRNQSSIKLHWIWTV